MARNHAHLLTSIWANPDWVALSQSAQHTFLLLLSQPKLTRVGLLDVLPSRWSRLAADLTPDSIEGSLDDPTRSKPPTTPSPTSWRTRTHERERPPCSRCGNMLGTKKCPRTACDGRGRGQHLRRRC